MARRSGATFVEGVASVGLVRLWADRGRTRQALDGYRTLLVDWRRTGHWTQLWTTLRNLAVLLADTGQPEAAALVVAAADAAPEAAEVTVDAVAAELAATNERISAELGPELLAAVRARAASLPRTDVVDAALEAIGAPLSCERARRRDGSASPAAAVSARCRAHVAAEVTGQVGLVVEPRRHRTSAGAWPSSSRRRAASTRPSTRYACGGCRTAPRSYAPGASATHRSGPPACAG